MHDAVLDYVRANVSHAVTSVLEFGSRNLNGSVRPLFPHATRYVGVDLYPGPDVDVVGDAATVWLPPQFDAVVCTEVFEHVDDDAAAAIIRNAWAHLKPGGVFVATMAGPGRAPHSALAATDIQPGEFYRNVDRPLLAGWLEAAGFAFYEIDRARLDLRCTARKESPA